MCWQVLVFPVVEVKNVITEKEKEKRLQVLKQDVLSPVCNVIQFI